MARVEGFQEFLGNVKTGHPPTAREKAAVASDPTDLHDEMFRSNSGNHLPRSKAYIDSGCQVAPLCAECPLPACIYDFSPKEVRGVARDLYIKSRKAAGASVEDIATEIGTSVRTIGRQKESTISDPVLLQLARAYLANEPRYQLQRPAGQDADALLPIVE